MPDPNCGKLDLSRIAADDMLTKIVFNDEPGGKNTGTAYVRAEVDENTVVILPGRSGIAPPGVYCVIKFNEGCFVDMCSDATDFNPALANLSNHLQVSLANADTPPAGDEDLPAPDGNGNRNPETSSRVGSSETEKRAPSPTICGVNADKLNPAQNAVDAHSVNDHGFQPAAIFPDKVNIPLKSNTTTYGPYLSPNFNNIRGGAEIIVNTDLAPWNFGSNATLSKAGNLLASNQTTGLKKAETGSVTKPGLPIIVNLGAAVANGPYLTSMNVSFGASGITTNYEFRTFNPKVAALSRMSVERFKELRQARQEQLKLLKSDAINQNRINQKLNRLRHQQRLYPDLHFRVARQASLQRVLVGELYPFALKDEAENDLGQRSVVGLSTLSKSVSEMVYDFDKKAYMSLDGLFGPVSKDGDGNLPQFANIPDYDGHLASPVLPQPPIQVDIDDVCNSTDKEYNVYNLDLTQEYFDPLINKFEEHTYHTGAGAGHVIDIVGRENKVTNDGIITNLISETSENRYSEDYRFLAFRGPLVLHSWGYDLDGKPIPNEEDTVSDTKSGVFKQTNLKDKFLKDWLKKPACWPVAPIDLRFDRKRGLWVSPQPYKIVVLKIVKEVEPFGEGKGVLINYGDKLYDSDGTEITTTSGACCENILECNWLDVVTNVCLTPQGLVIKKLKIRVSDIKDGDCCDIIIPTTSCDSSSSTGGSYSSSTCECVTIDCSSSSSSVCNEITEDVDGIVTIADRIGRRHKVGCYVYAYYDTSTSVYIVLQN